MPREFMPILRRPEFKLPWVMIAPHEKQAFRNHGQTLEQLAQRGGLSFTEAVAIMCDLPFDRVKLDEGFNKNWLEERIAAAGVAGTLTTATGEVLREGEDYERTVAAGVAGAFNDQQEKTR